MSSAGGCAGAGKCVLAVVQTVDQVANSQSEGYHPRVRELLVKEDALYVLGRVEQIELGCFIDTD